MQDSPSRKWIPLLAVLALVAVNWTGVKGSVYGLLPPPSPSEMPAWRTDYHAALAESQSTGKPVLVDFTADWCPPCRVMEREVWPDEQVRQTLNQETIPLRLDVDIESTDALVQSRRVRSIPTVLLLDSAGNEVARAGLVNASQLLAFLETHEP